MTGVPLQSPGGSDVVRVCTLASIPDGHSLLGSEIKQGLARTILPSLETVDLTNSWPGLIPCCQGRRQGKGRKESLEEHISEAQRPSDNAQNHIAFKHRGSESETHGTHSLSVTHSWRNQGKPKSTWRPQRPPELIPLAVLGKEVRGVDREVLFRSNSHQQDTEGSSVLVRVQS